MEIFTHLKYASDPPCWYHSWSGSQTKSHKKGHMLRAEMVKISLRVCPVIFLTIYVRIHNKQMFHKNVILISRVCALADVLHVLHRICALLDKNLSIQSSFCMLTLGSRDPSQTTLLPILPE